MRVYIILGLVLGCTSLPMQKQHSKLESHLLNKLESIEDQSLKCEICKSTVGILQVLMKSGKGEDVITKVGLYICKKFKLTSARVCDMGAKVFVDQVWQIIVSGFVKPNNLCGLILGEGCAHTTPLYPSWNITIPGPTKFTPTSSNIGVKTGKGPTKKVLHLSDTHIDNDYLEGSAAQCASPLCCRKETGFPKEGEPAAGKYGYPGWCDTNHLMLHTMFQHIKEHHGDFEYILWTGDVPSHDVWNQTKGGQINAIHQAAALIRKYFPGKKVFPTIGNHESFPVNSFPPPEIWDWNIPEYTTQWLFDTLADDWGTWLPKECQETIKKGGYYTALVHKGLRIVSLDTNYGHNLNWWLALESDDPGKQLQWLVSVLLQAEKVGEKVHIIGHIPPGMKLHWWSYNFYKIVDRFQHSITGQFYGHTHHDEFRIFYDMKTFKSPTNIAYVGPSVTTYHELNPGYRVYEVDAGYANSSLSVVDHHTYILNLAKVAKTGNAIFELEYSAKAVYKLKNLSPSAWNDLLDRMFGDDALFQVLYRAFTKQHVIDTCHFGCRVKYLCVMKTALKGRDFCDMSEKEEQLFSMWMSKTYNKC